MKTGLLILVTGLLCVLLNDSLLYLQVRRYFKRKFYTVLFWLHSLFFVACIVVYHFFIPTLKGPDAYFWVAMAVSTILLFYAPKVVYIILNTFAIGLRKLNCLPASRIVGRTAWGIAGITFFLILHGMTWGRSDYQIEKIEVCLSKLPASFNGYRVVQLTDLHLGSYSRHYQGIARLVEKVNALQPDLIVFTGDMINSFASEITPWARELEKLKAKHGKYAVTGNHDHGIYVKWATPREREKNMEDFFTNMEDMGFTLLNNANVPLVMGSDTIYLAGVENCGHAPFPCFGDLPRALAGTSAHPVILLSHDPSHWRREVVQSPVALMLAGHTHAMQMGMRLGNFQWSPAKYLYPEYNGLYHEDGHQLYVSRGVGYLGFAGRIGQRPEITLLQLTNRCP